MKQPLEQILGRSVDELKTTSPQGNASPGTTAAPVDRAASKRAELRRMEQERRRREAVSVFIVYDNRPINVILFLF